MKEKGQQIIHCKNCGESRLNVDHILIFNLGLIFLVVGIVVPFIGWFIALPMGLIMLLIGFLIEKASDSKSMLCLSCKNKFKVSKELFAQYKKAIK